MNPHNPTTWPSCTSVPTLTSLSVPMASSDLLCRLWRISWAPTRVAKIREPTWTHFGASTWTRHAQQPKQPKAWNTWKPSGIFWGSSVHICQDEQIPIRSDPVKSIERQLHVVELDKALYLFCVLVLSPCRIVHCDSSAKLRRPWPKAYKGLGCLYTSPYKHAFTCKIILHHLSNQTLVLVTSRQVWSSDNGSKECRQASLKQQNCHHGSWYNGFASPGTGM